MSFPVPANENARLAAIGDLGVPDSLPSDPMDAVVRLAKALFQAPIAAVSLMDAAWQRILASSGFTEPLVRRSVSVCAHTIMGDSLFVVPDLARDPRFCRLPYVAGPPGLRFYAGVPLRREAGVNLGSLCVFDHCPRALAPGEERSLLDLGQLASGLLGLQHANVALRASERTLQAAVSTDPLTGCLNRSGLDTAAAGLFEAPRAAGEGAALILVDLDHFKSVNDRFGHAGGDAVLRECGARLAASLRKGDLVARVGGDEFCLVLRSAPARPDLERVLGRIVNAFREPVGTEAGEIACSVSVGAALAPPHPVSRAALAKRADDALYEAKAAGRAQFRIAGPVSGLSPLR